MTGNGRRRLRLDILPFWQEERSIVALVRDLKIKWKLTAGFLVFGLVPALLVLAIYLLTESKFEAAFREPIKTTAVALGDVIDRNLFERYGDVQAFALNPEAKDQGNWREPSADNPLVEAMNNYMVLYGVYRLTVLVDTKGEVLAVNSADRLGKPIDTASLYQAKFADATWFKKAIKGEFLAGTNGFTGTVVEQPARDASVAKVYGDDGYVIPFAAPVKDGSGQILGVWVNFAAFEVIEDIVATFYRSFAEQGMTAAEITLLDPQGRVIVDFDPLGQGKDEYKRELDTIGKLNLVEGGVAAAVAAVGGKTGSLDAKHTRKGILQATGYAHTKGAYDYPGLNWSVLVRIPAAEAYVTVRNVQWIMVGTIVAASFLLLAAGLWTGAAASRPIQRLTEVMSDLAKGNNAVEIPAADRGDEMGEMARAVQVFKDNAIEAQRLAAVQEQERQAKEKRAHRIEGDAREFDSKVSGLLQTVAAAGTQLQQTAGSMSQTAERTNSQAGAAASASEEASTNVQTVASSAEELSASISEIANQVAKSTDIASRAVDGVQKANANVQGLADAAQKIGEVVKLINDIASQTNLLALNATIEAARAGEAGKGFAVVASEVKNLASQTAKATEQIAAQIAGVQSATGDAVSAIQAIGVTIGEISAISAAIASAVEEQGSATKEIARNMQQAATGTNEVSSNISSVTKAAGETGLASGQVLDAAGELSRQAEKLRLEIDGFVAKVRAA